MVNVTVVRGRAYFTPDQDQVRRLGVGTVRDLPREATRGTHEILRDLEQMTWKLLTANQYLGPWDMFWTRSDGRVEIELVKRGRSLTISEALAVKESNGRFTGRLRLPREMYFILDPEQYDVVRVRKVIGNVSLATSRGQVDEFFRKHSRFHGSLREWTREAVLEWQERLKAEDLE